MLRVLGSSRYQHGLWQRRELLRAGAFGLLGLPGFAGTGLSLANERASSTAELPGFGRAKQCLVLYIYGAWSQLDTFDPKPDAPAEIRGEFGTIDTCLSGVRICEHLPRVASVLDRCTLIRSMSHPWNIHSAAYTLTGNPDTERIEGRPRHPDQWPYFGGVIDHLGDHGQLADGSHSGQQLRGIPRNVMLPWRQSFRAAPNRRAGTFGGFLGPAYDPLWTNFRGEAPLGDPFRAVTADGRFVFDTGDSPQITLDALDRRRSLLSQFEEQYASLQNCSAPHSFNRHRERAYDFLSTPQVRDALRIDREPLALREEYGLTLFGQACLSARRLLESGVKLVTVVWDEFGKSDESWDTHHDHHARMKEFLLPGFDRAYSALLRDMDRRGLLDDTLVLCLSEHGRTPKFYATSAGAPGRDHWSRAYCQLFAGAGIPGGQVIGRSDETAAYATDRPIDPKDILCTGYHLLGVDPRRELMASPGRPVPLVGGGEVVRELLG
ncbi:MAG: DUF1501 domain-containing protein [Planctomycetota bacterium]|nr:DUF1501 domain-containing protein [Planctomycetota bacterium]